MVGSRWRRVLRFIKVGGVRFLFLLVVVEYLFRDI